MIPAGMGDPREGTTVTVTVPVPAPDGRVLAMLQFEFSFCAVRGHLPGFPKWVWSFLLLWFF